MVRNLNVYGIVIQFLNEANMILTSSGKLDEMPPCMDGLLISARGEVEPPPAVPPPTFEGAFSFTSSLKCVPRTLMEHLLGEA